ncbi:MAG: hypothetical protein KDE46_09965, partial [Caldilineaceae bacterium]|nr:hypothetical protein [Caldilineaceae bacterium]
MTTTAARVTAVQESFAQYISRISMRLALPTGGIVALLVILLNTDRSAVPLSDDLRSFVPVAFAYMLVTAGLLVIGITLIERAFRELQLSLVQGTLLAVLGSTAFTFWVVGDAMRLDTRKLLTLVVVILASGVYLTLIAIDDPQWWRVSFSYLGKLESNVNWLFNATLIFTGILLLIWYSYFMSDYRILLRHGIADARWAMVIRVGLLWIGVGVMIVGLF